MENKLEYGDYLIDPTYEADAPQFFDFERLLKPQASVVDLDDDGDSWFEKNENILHETSVEYEKQVDLIKNIEKFSPKDSSKMRQVPEKRSVLGPLQTKVGSNYCPILSSTIVNELSQIQVSESAVNNNTKRCAEREDEICHPVGKPNSSRRRSRSLNNKVASKIVPKKLTMPQSPNLHTAARNQERQSNESLSKNSTNVQNHWLSEKSTLGRSNSTIRHNSKTSTKDSTETLTSLGSVAIKRTATPQNPNVVRRVTTPKPFSFQNRENELLEKRKKLIQENEIKLESEKSKHQFKARPIPKSPLSNIVSQKPRTPLIVKPFSFKTDEIHAEHERRLKAQQLLNEEQRLKMLNFRAQPAKVLHQVPFKPKPLEHTKLLPKQIQLKTEKRAGEWQKFDGYLKEKEHEKMEILKQRQMAMEEEEKFQVQEMRRLAVHKAQPVKHYKNVDPRPPPTITCPQTPCFKTDGRVKKRLH